MHLLFSGSMNHFSREKFMSVTFVCKPGTKRIAAVGSALVDICLLEDDTFITATGAPKGGMTFVDSRQIREMLDRSKKTPVIVPGGSACNTILGIGMLGNPARFIGKRGNDAFGNLFEQAVRSHHVEPMLQTSSSPTGHVLSVITPDAQRTMFTFLGASSEADPNAITSDLFTDVALVHVEGYLLFNRDLILGTLDAVKNAKARISLDLASFTVVEAARPLLEDICHEYVDILIANEDEARAFTGVTNEIDALEALSLKAEYAVLKLGKRGSLIAHDGKHTAVERMGDGRAIDTTGAGDLWAAGFLYGLVNGFSIEKSGKLASACGFEVCQVMGAQIPEEGWKRIKSII
jgi:sugar/nucleoside kinase (ribokinase family)